MNSKLLTNFVSLSGAEGVSKILTFLAFAFLARKFGSAGYGYVEWAGAILMCASLIVDQGFSSYGAREIAKSPERTSELVSQIVGARLLLAIVAYAALAVFALTAVTDVSVRNLILVFGLSLWLLPFLLQWTFQGHDRMHLVAVTQLVRQAVFATVIFLFVNNVSDLVMVGLAEVAAVGTAAALCIVLYLKKFPGQKRLRLKLSSDTFRVGGTIGLSQLFWVMKMFGATVIVGIIATAAETGMFGGAMRLFIAVHTFVWLYFFNLLPSLSRAWTNDRAGFARLIRGSMRLVVAIAIPACVVGIVFAPYIMSFVYGREFIDGAGALRWMAIACLLAAISGHFRFGLIAAGRQSREMLSSAAGAATVIVLLPLGYFTGGISFAALGICFAEAVILIVSWLQSRDLLETVDRPIIDAASYGVASNAAFSKMNTGIKTEVVRDIRGNGISNGSARLVRNSSVRRTFRHNAIRLFLTCSLVFLLHFATNTVREIYPALSLGDRFSFDVSEYNGLHPDIFEMPGRGVFINNNPGASMMGAVPYFFLHPAVNAIVDRVKACRALDTSGQQPAYDSIYPMAREFYQKSRERGFDIKFGLGAAITQALVMVPISALSVLLMYWVLLQLINKPRTALLLSLLYAFATPVFYRTGQLNQNLLLAHFAFFSFVLLWRPGSDDTQHERTPFFFLAGLCAGWTVVLDYSGLVVLAALTVYAFAKWRALPSNERSVSQLGRFAGGVAICGAILMAYQWSSFGNPILPAQSYMPSASYTDAGYRGFSFPSLDLLFDTAFSPRFGLFTSAPLLLLAFYVPAWLRKSTSILKRPELILVISFVSLFFIFCAANQYGRMQFNTGVRHIVPVVPFVFLLAANVLVRLPALIAAVVGTLGTYWMWCLVMYRDVEQGSGILEAIKNITLGGFQLPWLKTLERMGYVQASSVLPLFLLAAAMIWILWNVNRHSRLVEA